MPNPGDEIGFESLGFSGQEQRIKDKYKRQNMNVNVSSSQSGIQEWGYTVTYVSEVNPRSDATQAAPAQAASAQRAPSSHQPGQVLEHRSLGFDGQEQLIKDEYKRQNMNVNVSSSQSGIQEWEYTINYISEANPRSDATPAAPVRETPEPRPAEPSPVRATSATPERSVTPTRPASAAAAPPFPKAPAPKIPAVVSEPSAAVIPPTRPLTAISSSGVPSAEGAHIRPSIPPQLPEFEASAKEPLTKFILLDKLAEKEVKTIIPLVPIQDIVDEFNKLKDTHEGKPDHDLFQCEQRKGPPITYIFVFPNKESMDKFINELVENGQVKLPKQEQNTQPEIQRSRGLSSMPDTTAHNLSAPADSDVHQEEPAASMKH